MITRTELRKHALDQLYKSLVSADDTTIYTYDSTRKKAAEWATIALALMTDTHDMEWEYVE